LLRLTVEPAAFARRRINVKAELGGDHDLVADGRQRFPDQGFVRPGTVDLGSIKQGDAEVWAPRMTRMLSAFSGAWP
jgi:hypothetical protein